MPLSPKRTGLNISGKLMLLVVMVCAAFTVIVLIVSLAFSSVERLSADLVRGEMGQVTAGAAIARDLSQVFSGIHLLSRTYQGREEKLESEGLRLLTLLAGISAEVSHSELSASLEGLSVHLSHFLDISKQVKQILARRKTIDRVAHGHLDRMDGLVSRWLIEHALAGRDTHFIDQLASLITGYRESLLLIGKLQAEQVETSDLKEAQENTKVLEAIDDLSLRLQTITASTPDIAVPGRVLSADIDRYRQTVVQLEQRKTQWRSMLVELEEAERRTLAILEQLDRLSTESADSVEQQVADIVRSTRMYVLGLSLLVVLATVLFVLLLIRHSINKPMAHILQGMDAIAESRFEMPAPMRRTDEWGAIESGMHQMGRELAKSYAELEARVTERTEELEQSRDAAQAASRTKSEFLAIMSHEIRTPMNGILGANEILTSTSLDNRQRRFVEIIDHSGKHLLELIDGILDYSRIEAGKLEIESQTFDLNALVTEVAAIFRVHTSEKGLVLSTRIPQQGRVHVMGDAGRLRQVLMNLLGNAVKFTPSGEIALSLEYLRQGDEGLDFKISVSDTGIGIDPRWQEDIFKAFTQVEGGITRRYGGAGLGLSITHKLVAAMGGEIGLSSTPGQGSEFWVRLHLPQGEAMPSDSAMEARAPLTDVQDRPVQVLLVEDNPVNQEIAKIMLESLQCRVETADDGKGALELFERSVFDMVFLDLHMPQMDGMAASREIRRRERQRGMPAVPIVAMTADVGEGIEAECRAAGMDDYLSKPVEREQLSRLLNKLLPGESALEA